MCGSIGSPSRRPAGSASQGERVEPNDKTHKGGLRLNACRVYTRTILRRKRVWRDAPLEAWYRRNV
jgi:hypothetical protein